VITYKDLVADRHHGHWNKVDWTNVSASIADEDYKIQDLLKLILPEQLQNVLIIVAVWSKSWTVFARSNTGIMCSNPAQCMDVCIVCIYSVFVLFCL
jgi:hypothetical protein